MGFLILATLLLSWDVQGWMAHAFYPVLLLVLVAASLGVPIPEDVPLIAAGVILSQQPEAATWMAQDSASKGFCSRMVSSRPAPTETANIFASVTSSRRRM